MDKVILKKFAVESRQELMDKVRGKIKLFYVDEDFNSEQKGDIYILSNEKHTLSLTNEELKKRELLIKRIKELSLEQVIEEATYTWFNRIIAIRYMEINDMLPLTKDNQSLGIRVLSSKDNTSDPEILKFTNLMNPELDIDFKKEKYIDLKDENEKFKYILLLICKKLGRVIPQVFDGVTDYIDILIPDNLLNDTGFITKVVSEIPENNFNKVEIIGWLYQYYNQIEKDRVISAKKAYKKNEIAYATQLFTPDWIVKYMVENTLGKYWVECNENNGSNLSLKISNSWKYFIKDNLNFNNNKVNPKEITFIDPCCGSGHILVYAFEVFYQIYLSFGYNKKDIPELILSNNLYGLDIDDRAEQLSILSIILKAREYDKNIFNKNITEKLNIMSIKESNIININCLDYLPSDKLKNQAQNLLHIFENAKEIGSLLILKEEDYSELLNEIKCNETIFGIELKEKFIPLIKQFNILKNKYDIVVTNPPYLNNSLMPKNIKQYLAANYCKYKTDLFSAFIIKMFNLSKSDSLIGTISPFVWMYIKSYEELRKYIIDEKFIDSLVQLEYNSFDVACVPVATYIFRNKKYKYGIFINLSKFPGSDIQDSKTLYAINNECDYKYKANSTVFSTVPDNIIAYWFNQKYFDIFDKSKKLIEYADPKQGLATGENNRFIRQWYEVSIARELLNADSIIQAKESEKKWYPYNKGGEFRKWYGNNDYVVNWENDGYEIKNFKDENGKLRSRPQNTNTYFNESITWSKISNSTIAFRYKPYGHIYDVAGTSIFGEHNILIYLLGLNNSKVISTLLRSLSPTMNYEVGQISSIPVIIADEENKKVIIDLVKKNILLEKDDWDSFETSWDFKKHPLISEATLTPQQIKKEQDNGFQVCNNLEEAYNHWKDKTKDRFKDLKKNEEELNDIFIKIYGLEDELSKNVEDKDITIRLADKERDIKSLISYAVGCMFGRYSLDKDGLIYAGGDFDNVYKKYKKTDGSWAGSSLSNYKYLNNNGNEIELSFEVDNDNIIPITDEAYFSDDIVERFKTFIKKVYGDNTFNENMDFIAEALGKKGTETSEETIRRYFVNDFFNDHVKMYQKRPIYWLLDSGKKNGFKALVYMHRYNENLIPKARLDYLHRVQTTYEKLLSDVNYKLTTDLSMTEKKEAKNRQADLNTKLNEIKEYDEKIAHIANQRISIDLDDGVKVNYEKFKDILAKIK